MTEEPQYYVVPRLRDLKIGKTYRIISMLHGLVDNHETKYHGSLKSIDEDTYTFELLEGGYSVQFKGSNYIDAHHFWYCEEEYI